MKSQSAPLAAACLLVCLPALAAAADMSAAALPNQSAAQWSWSAPALPKPVSPSRQVEELATPLRSVPQPLTPGTNLTLKRAISLALTYHPLLREAAAQSGAAQERVGEARSYLGPQLYGVAQYLRSTDNGIGNTSYYDPFGLYPRMTGRNHDLPASEAFNQSWDTSNNYMGGLALSQFLFDFGRRHNYVMQRQFEAQAADANRQVTQLDLIFEVSARYFRLLQAMQLVRVYEKAVEQRQFHLHEARTKAKAGLRPQLDVYLTTAAVERAQLHLVDARNQVADAKVALDNAMGLSESSPDYRPAEVLTYQPITEKIADLLHTAFLLRPDLKMVEDEARAMGAQIAEYRSDYLPTVSAVGGYAGMGTGTPVVNNFNVGLMITWPIFNSYLTTDQVGEAKFHQHALDDALEDLRQRIILQVHTAYLDWIASVQRIQRAQAALSASQVELQLADQRYRTGLTNIVELEDAQRYYTQDDAAYANALYSYSLAKAAIEQATGSSLAQNSLP
jgi:outer membrane protein